MDAAAPHGSHTGPAHVGTERARAEKFWLLGTDGRDIKKKKKFKKQEKGEIFLPDPFQLGKGKSRYYRLGGVICGCPGLCHHRCPRAGTATMRRNSRG